MNYSTISFLDLDDTIFQSHRKCAGRNIVGLAAEGSTTERSSFISKQQHDLLNMLKATTLVVPTTARDRKAFDKVLFEWDGPAILNHGGTILNPEGTEDQRWSLQIAKAMEGYTEELSSMLNHISQHCLKSSMDTRIKAVGEQSPLYLVIKHNQQDVRTLQCLKDYINYSVLPGLDESYYLHFNDNNLAILPTCINKANAVQYLLESYFENSDLTTIGIGDSSSDLTFMGICDFVMTPANSQIMTSLKEASE